MKKVIIVCPYYETGGPESLHQVCHAVNEMGGDAYMWYFGEHDTPHPSYAPYYNLKVTKDLIDDENTIIVLPECEGKMINMFSKSKIYFWWLSVDNNNFFQFGNSFDNPRVYHLYQSYYALHFLMNNEAIYYQPQFDYINVKFVEDSLKVGYDKEDIICYNPRKGFDVTKPIIDAMPEYNWVPLYGMTREQVIDTLKRSKVYLDLGYHPGKDKFPREAVLMNNCVVAGFRGSAMFYNDVPIDPLKYKFEVDDKDSIVERLKDCILNYSERIKDFELYKNVVKNQREEAINHVKQIFFTGNGL